MAYAIYSIQSTN